MNTIEWYSKFELVKPDGSKVIIDKPSNHDASMYALPKNFEVDEQEETWSDLDNPMNSIISLTFNGEPEAGDLPLFTARFKVEYGSVQELAFGFFVLQGFPKIVDVIDDGIIIECLVTPVCILNPEGNDTILGRFNLPVECWFEQEYESGRIEVASVDGEHAGYVEHCCEGTIYEFTVGIHHADYPNFTEYGRSIDRMPELLSHDDEEDNETFWTKPEIDEIVTAPDGIEWRVLGVEHED